MLSTILTALFLQFVPPACPVTILVEHIQIKVDVLKSEKKYIAKIQWRIP